MNDKKGDIGKRIEKKKKCTRMCLNRTRRVQVKYMSFEKEANCKNEDEYVIRIKKSLSPSSSPPVEGRKKKKSPINSSFLHDFTPKRKRKICDNQNFIASLTNTKKNH